MTGRSEGEELSLFGSQENMVLCTVVKGEGKEVLKACLQFESLQTTGDWTLPTMIFLLRGPVPLLVHSLSGGTGPCVV